jgi:hypothetical protein
MTTLACSMIKKLIVPLPRSFCKRNIKRFKFFFIPTLFTIIFLNIIGCTKKVDPANLPMVKTKVHLTETTTFLNFCSLSQEGGSEKKFKVEITVKGLSTDPANPLNFMWDGTFDLSNNPTNWEDFEINTPETGTYIVEVTVRTTDGDCYKCCGKAQGTTTEPACNAGSNGQPKWYGNSATINASPPSAQIDIKPKFIRCSNCGC